MKFSVFVLLALALGSPLQAQQEEALTPWQSPVLQLPSTSSPPPRQRSTDSTERNGPMALLYRELRGVGLNEEKVFHVREAVLDRGELHIYLTDGTIAFTNDIRGRVTGAYFLGEG